MHDRVATLPLIAIVHPEHGQAVCDERQIAEVTAKGWSRKPMPVAILCPGPSLLQTWPALGSIGYDSIIAVNRAIEHQPDGVIPDWWCCMDATAWPLFNPPAKPLVGVVGSIGPGAPLNGRQIDITVSADEAHNTFLAWSSTTAVYFAAMQLTASRIDIYGADMSGDRDFLGMPYAGRSDERWTRERDLLERLSTMLGSRGIVVNRVLVAPSPNQVPQPNTPKMGKAKRA
jgi:hypothetical protein